MYTISLNPARLTPEDADDLRAYIAILPTIALLTAAQEAAADAETLVTHNMRLSAAVACHYAGRGVPLADLIQEGNMGLMSAAKSFDPSRGRFSTYAVKPVRERILRAIHNQAHTIRRPVWAQDGSKRPDILEKTRVLVGSRETVSGDGVHGSAYGGSKSEQAGQQNRTLFDFIPDTTDTEAEAIGNIERRANTARVKRAMAQLCERDRDLIERRHFRGQNIPDIAAALGYTNGSARQLLSDARKRLRALLEGEAEHV